MRDLRKAKRSGASRRLSAGVAVSFTALLTAGVVGAGFVTSAASAATPKAAPRASSGGLAYTSLAPTRVADTRCGASPQPSFCASENLPTANASLSTVAAGGSINVAMPSSVPSNASAAVFNVTAVDQTGPGFLTVYATGGTLPVVSNLNFNAAQATFGTSNLVTVPLGSSSITVFNGPTTGGSPVDVVVDLEGYYAPPAGASLAGEYFPLTPARILDTRGSGGTPLGANTTGNLTVAGAGGVPSSGVSAVLLNVTVTDTTGSSFLTAWPAGATQPVVSNLNWTSGETLANKVLIPLGTGGSNAGAISLYNLAGSTDVVVDVMGYFSGSGATTAGALFTPVTPARMADTRCGASPAPSFCASENLPSGNASLTSPSGGQSVTVGITGNDGVPSGATAAALDVIDVSPAGSTSSPPTGGNFLTVYAAGSTLPGTSDVNWVPGDVYNVVANGAYGGLSSGGATAVYQGPTTAGKTDVVVDVFGYFAPSTTPPVAESYTVTGPTPSATPTVSTSASTAGDVTYTVTGFTSSNTPNGYVDIALFPSTGTNAPVTSSGATTFVSSGGSGVAGSAKGEATSNGQTTTTVAAPNQGSACVTGSNCYAYIASVNGVPNASAPDLVTKVAVTAGGTLTFVVNSFQVDGAIPVVFTEPTATATGTLQVGTNGQPATGYSYGTGAATTWSVAAPAAAAGSFTDWVVNSVNNTAGTFVACANGTSPLFCYTFTDSEAGSTYNYTDIGGSAGAISMAQFQSFLSGGATQTNSLPSPVLGDEVNVSPYNPSGPSTFAFSNGVAVSSCSACTIVSTPTAPSGQADVPAAPSGLADMASTTPSGEQLNWTTPTNLDVTSDSTALYTVYVAPVVSGTVGAYAKAGTITNATTPVVTSAGAFTLANCSTALPTCVVITGGTTAGDTYSVVVSAKSGTGGGNVAEEGPVSGAEQFMTSSTPAASLAPLSISTGVSGTGHLATTNALTVVFNGTVSLASSFSLSLTDGAGNVATINNTDATAALTSTGGGTNNTVVYTLTGAPVVTSGSSPSLTNLEVLSQTGVSNSVGPWNVPGSAASNLTLTTGPTRVLGGANSALPAGPTVTPVTTSTSSLSIAACTTGDTVNVYSENGALLNSATATCTAGTATVTLSSSVTAATVLEVTQSVPVVSGTSGGYESAATITAGVSPTPLATTGSLTPLGGTVTVTLTTLPGATVYLSFATTALALGQGAKVGATSLTTTPTAFTATSAGQIVITYTAGTGVAGVDTITAQNAATGPTFTVTDTYTY